VVYFKSAKGKGQTHLLTHKNGVPQSVIIQRIAGQGKKKRIQSGGLLFLFLHFISSIHVLLMAEFYLKCENRRA
jgi:hypothetical protein